MSSLKLASTSRVRNSSVTSGNAGRHTSVKNLLAARLLGWLSARANRCRQALGPSPGGETVRTDSDEGNVATIASLRKHSTRNALCSPQVISSITTENGNPMMMVALVSASTSPTMSMAKVRSPVVMAQKTRSHGLASVRGVGSRELRLAITNAPESAEVTYSNRPTNVATLALKTTPGYW